MKDSWRWFIEGLITSTIVSTIMYFILLIVYKGQF